jgi:hypothetical protein
MRHPTPGELLELHFGELAERRARECWAHLTECPGCSALRDELEWVERELAAGPWATPPPDGLERVLSRIETLRPGPKRRAHALGTLAACAPALLAGWVAVQQGGVVGVMTFFALGSLVTLAIAPVLILESKGRPS